MEAFLHGERSVRLDGGARLHGVSPAPVRDGEHIFDRWPETVWAFRTFRDGKRRTVGLVTTGTSCLNATSEDALKMANSWILPPRFSDHCTALGKIVFVDLASGKVVAFQHHEKKAEQVYCGNAYTAAAAITGLYAGQNSFDLAATNGSTGVAIDGTVTASKDSLWNVESRWRIQPQPSDFVFEPGEPPSGAVTVLNRYKFTVGPKLGAPVQLDGCQHKHCRITPGVIAEIEISSCGRIHGAVPQTGAITLQMARSVFAFIQVAVPSGVVKHAAGIERLPPCYWHGSDFIAVLPKTQVELTKPMFCS